MSDRTAARRTRDGRAEERCPGTRRQLRQQLAEVAHSLTRRLAWLATGALDATARRVTRHARTTTHTPWPVRWMRLHRNNDEHHGQDV